MMTKEARHHIEHQIILYAPMLDEQTVRRRGWIPSNVTFFQGIGTFNGTSSKIDTGEDMIGVKPITTSMRIKFNGWGSGCGGTGFIVANGKYIIDVTDAGDYIGVSSDGSTFVNSAGGSIALNTWYHIVVTRNAAGDKTNIYIDGVLSGDADQDSGTPASGTTDVVIGDYSGAGFVDADIDYITVYNYVLSSEEILNTFEGKRFTDIGVHGEILSISASSGSIIDRWENELTITTTSVFRDGNVRCILFNGSTSVVETTLANFINSVSFWMKPVTDTESIIDLDDGREITTSGGTLTAAWADDIYVNGVAGTTVETGVWNLITCTVGTAIPIIPIDIGRITTTYFDGLLNDVKIYEGVLVAQECSQAFTNNKFRYGK